MSQPFPTDYLGQPQSAGAAEVDVAALLEAQPSTAPSAQHPAMVAAQPSRAPQSVSVVDPRGDLGVLLDQSYAVPTAPVAANAADRPEIERLLVGLVHNGGSDMHLYHGEMPRYRMNGGLLPVGGEEPLEDAEILRMLEEIVRPEQWSQFLAEGDLDTAYQMRQSDGAALTVRFRVNVFRAMGHVGCVFRVIPTQIKTLDELGIPPQVKKLATKPRGLVLVCGPTGSGKSTTLAGLVDLINTTRSERIFTFEDPIEFTHSSKKCLVSHREIGTDTPTFAEGLRRVRREDPDIILIGEMRDYETIDAAIEAADTGHLVLATLHTNSAAETISRIINSFPAERQEQVRVTLASVLVSVVVQVLVPATNGGRVVATEIMMVTDGIRNSIRENDIPAIRNALTDTQHGSIALDAHLAELFRSQQVTKREALKKASSPDSLERYLGNDGGSII